MVDIKFQIIGRVNGTTATDLKTWTIADMLQDAKVHPERWNITFQKLTSKVCEVPEEMTP